VENEENKLGQATREGGFLMREIRINILTLGALWVKVFF
jgi:hypothetical protein